MIVLFGVLGAFNLRQASLPVSGFRMMMSSSSLEGISNMSLQKIEARAREVLTARQEGSSPITALLMDDDFCTLVMQHRLSQGLRLPEQSANMAPSGRLAYLQALSSGKGVAEARALCDNSQKRLERLRKFEAVEDEEIRAALIETMKAVLDPGQQNSYWVGIYLLQGEARIPQNSLPLHEVDTPADEAIPIVLKAMGRRPDAAIRISDNNEITGSTGFIRLGKDPAHFGFPETAGPKAGTNAALLHYEIDHPGGDFVFFTQINSCDRLFDKMMQLDDECPLYINDMPQMMALNNYFLQSFGAFCACAGDTEVRMVIRDGVITVAESPDFAPEADAILERLRGRGEDEAKLPALEHYLRNGVEAQDDDWDIIEEMTARHPDLLGHKDLDMGRSRIFGMPKADLQALALQLWDGDEAKAHAEVEEALEGCQALDLPAGRWHLYIPNLASNRMEQGLDALNRLSGRNDKDVMFVLSDHLLELGDDPHLRTTMRKLSEAEPDCVLDPGW